ncbi:AAA family ATPase [Oceanisphaera sp. W20_SRM_FM3]|uniref:ATP-binding protein n=1 Tax=Oceanisphaera sp. W20_SRM_FM3 TaxID=3240267 RepID=UPI003F9C01FF
MSAPRPIPEFLRKKSLPKNTSEPCYAPLPMLWALRLLVLGGGVKIGLSKRRHDLDDFLQTLAPDQEANELTPSQIMSLLKAALSELESSHIVIPAPLNTNLQQLGASLGLNELSQEIVAFLVLIEQENALSQAMGLFYSHTVGTQQLVNLLAVALAQPRRQVASALAAGSPLLSCGLVEIAYHGQGLTLMTGLEDVLLYEQDGPLSLLQAFSSHNHPTVLTLDDFAHLQPFIDQLSRYLARNNQKPQSGVNILLYGAPGTGKTELTRALAAHLCCVLHEVKFANLQGEALNGRERFARYQICQQVLRTNAHSLVLFDEVEDVFNERISQGQKAWVNRLLEENPRPAFWLSNDISELDAAFIRRFDLVLAMPELTTTARLNIAKRLLGSLNVSQPWLAQLAKQPQLQPAHLARAAKVVSKLGYRKAEKIEAAMEELLANLYQALGFRWQRLNQAVTPCLFNPALCATDMLLTPMIEGLARSGMGRICLFGPPGTGKTALARHLAASLNKPLVAKKASDLLDAYLGGTEQKLAAAFAEATECGGVLLIDEADSLLANRAGAVRSWEVSQINELLVQMEQYNGILVMATNFMSHLDSAALRRFDFKIRFNFFNTEQAWQYFNTQLGLSQCLSLGSGLNINQQFYEQKVAHLYPLLCKLSQLTPGDFATVARRHKVMGEKLSPDSLLAGLQQEHSLKTADQSKPIGFLTS